MESNKELETRFKQITTFIFDVDGVFTDGSVILMPNGEMLRKMSTRDGYAVQSVLTQGYRVAILSGGSSEAVRARFENLGVPSHHIFLKINDKKEVYEEFLMTHQLKPTEVAFMGDDIPDFPVMQICGLAACPKDATKEILGIAHYVSEHKGGEGCVRQFIEEVLTAQGKWKINHHLSSI